MLLSTASCLPWDTPSERKNITRSASPPPAAGFSGPALPQLPLIEGTDKWRDFFPAGRLPSWGLRHSGRPSGPPILEADITLVSFVPSQPCYLLKLHVGQNEGPRRPQMTMVPRGEATPPHFPPCQIGLSSNPAPSAQPRSGSSAQF